MQTQKVIDHIVNWLKDYATKANSKGFVVGVSGGIDSAVVSTLAAKTGLQTLVLEMPIRQKADQVDRAQDHIEFLKSNFSNVEGFRVDLTPTFESFEKTTHCVQLTQSTIDANQRLFDEGEAVPEKAFTMGIKSIMQSKHILLIANGEKKAQIIRDAFFGPVTPKVPASILQLHNNVTVIVDKEAGKLIKDVL